jgi:hypothetical protein
MLRIFYDCRPNKNFFRFERIQPIQFGGRQQTDRCQGAQRDFTEQQRSHTRHRDQQVHETRILCDIEGQFRRLFWRQNGQKRRRGLVQREREQHFELVVKYYIKCSLLGPF